MSYKVFLVEDEIVTREGIRDNVDWETLGFEFCGEAPDGEIALPLIEDTNPDVLITDIKMPFMDGLQLSKIIREQMPWIKILILSGHNEFDYAQSAVKLGVTEYLLKPISAQDLNKILVELYKVLDQEKQEREKLIALQNKIKDNLLFTREKFLLKLVMGGISSSEAIEQSQQLELDITARYYVVMVIRVELCSNSPPFDYHEYQQVEQIISQLTGDQSDVLLTKKDIAEIILLIKGENVEQLLQRGDFLADLIRNKVESKTTCNTVIEMGSYQERLSDVHHSFAEALVKCKFVEQIPQVSTPKIPHDKLFTIKHDAIENYLRFGSIQEFDEFFSRTIRPIADIAQQSYMLRYYVFVDIIFSATQFVSDLGGEVEQLASEFPAIEEIISDIKSVEQFEAEMRRMFTIILLYRDKQAKNERKLTLREAKSYLDLNFSDPELKMRDVAQTFNISPGHFSTTFHQEFEITFRDYLCHLRIDHAKGLLRTTSMKCAEIAYQSGFNNSHYFSSVFKKKTGVSPREFRSAVA